MGVRWSVREASNSRSGWSQELTLLNSDADFTGCLWQNGTGIAVHKGDSFAKSTRSRLLGKSLKAGANYDEPEETLRDRRRPGRISRDEKFGAPNACAFCVGGWIWKEQAIDHQQWRTYSSIQSRDRRVEGAWILCSGFGQSRATRGFKGSTVFSS